MKLFISIILWTLSYSYAMEDPATSASHYTQEQVNKMTAKQKERALVNLETSLIKTLTEATSSSLAAQQLKHYFEEIFHSNDALHIDLNLKKGTFWSFPKDNPLDCLNLACLIIAGDCTDKFISYFGNTLKQLFYKTYLIDKSIQSLKKSYDNTYYSAELRKRNHYFSHWEQFNLVQSLIATISSLIEEIDDREHFLIQEAEMFHPDLENGGLSEKVRLAVFLSILLIMEHETNTNSHLGKNFKLIENYNYFYSRFSEFFNQSFDSYLSSISNGVVDLLDKLQSPDGTTSKLANISVAEGIRAIQKKDIKDKPIPQNYLLFLAKLLYDVRLYNEVFKDGSIPTKESYDLKISGVEWLTVYLMFKNYSILSNHPDLKKYSELSKDKLRVIVNGLNEAA